MTIAVLCGGDTPEREVSLRSGAAAAAALRRRGHRVVRLDPARRGFQARLTSLRPACAFIALHGGDGEGGPVQGFLETLAIPHTGAGTLSSALCLHKILSKRILRSYGIPTPDFVEIGNGGQPARLPFPLPAVVKAARLGSTIGVYIVRRKQDLAPAVRKALSFDREVLVERFVRGTEVTAAVLGNGSPTVLPLIEIAAPDGFYDYKAKYTPGGSRHIIPPRLPAAAIAAAERTAVTAYRALRCSGLARMEMIVDSRGAPQVLDVNTIPGFTATSLYPDAARAAGIPFDELCERLVSLAIEEWTPRRANASRR